MRHVVLLTLSLALAFPHARAAAQARADASARPDTTRWSAAERGAWAAVERGWEALRAEDVERFMATFHPRFLGWNMSRPAPLDVGAERRGTEKFLAEYDWVDYAIVPVAIRIVGDDAIVHYRYREVVRPAAGGAESREEGRATQVLRRVGGRNGAWKTLTIMSGPAPTAE